MPGEDQSAILDDTHATGGQAEGASPPQKGGKTAGKAQILILLILRKDLIVSEVALQTLACT